MASSAATGSKKELNESRAEALQALLNSISPEDASSQGQKLSSDQVKMISEKLGELLGDGDLGEVVGTQKRNEKGELLNEEGLPIVDIVEPVKEDTAPFPPPASVASPPIFDDPDLLPHWALSPAEKARRKAERERILDLLEDEEHIEQEREETAERERWRAELENRKAAAKTELESLRKARELQKKMGKALLRNVIETQENAEKGAELEAKERKVGKSKKAVSFADAPGERTSNEATSEDESKQWGDIALDRLRKGKTSLLTRAQMNNQPMKMDVVERHPGGAQAEPPAQREPDSDDESVPGSPVPADSDEGDVIRSDVDSDEQTGHEPLSDSDATDVEQMSDDGEPVIWQDEDFDYAQHQREVVLAYYEKRATIGMQAYSAMRAHSHDEDANEWDQPEVPLDATLASPPPKPSASRFKSEHPSSSTLASHSLGASVLPSSQTSSLKKAVRMGKLESGQLVGDDSDDDVTQEAREIVELLTRGDVANIGPQPSAAASTSASTAPLPGPPSSASTEDSTVPSKPKSKVSKFKLSLAQPQGRESSSTGSPSLQTPQMTSDRSSPKLTSPEPGTPISVPTPSSRPTDGRHNDNGAVIPEPIRRKGVHDQMPIMIVDSPSFRPPGSAPTTPSMIVDSPSFSPPSGSVPRTTATSSMPPMVVDSPSFIPPGLASTSVQPPPFQSFVLDSPSFQNPTSAQPPQASVPRSMSASTNPVAAGGRRTGVVMAAEVKESAPQRRGDAGEGGNKERKVSKFRAERM
ncbi:uncharacterized protein C8Q71DRAFT_736247 [Rhodofomes roseus]|uniref:DUF3835 domain-containing protein n=1 Tax=Rhodofomes roseus TaxID=34475 RepID=A0ABQ8KWG7_9APHY|nr:uncharacterized protein C8Q71DRAFT_736247 [Rhodofomes roseus]KAH9843177.1 hypothetical protein C8Q71DRAFT_736247 [Rhodofomes roseus]